MRNFTNFTKFLFYMILQISTFVVASNSTTTINWNNVDVFGSHFEVGHLFDGVPLGFYESLPDVNMTAMNWLLLICSVQTLYYYRTIL